jgi:hypothetical protein
MAWELIPQELKDLRQWVEWGLNDGKKVFWDKSNDPSTWKSFAEVEHCERIAFVISPNDLYVGVDLDDCIVDGVISDLACKISNAFRSVCYSEFSPSGTGIKILAKGKKPAGFRSVNRELGIECYDSNRFWCMTGNAFGRFDKIDDGQAAIDWLCNEYLSGSDRSTAAPRLATFGQSSMDLVQRARAYVAKCDPPAVGSRNNQAFSNAGHLHAMIGEHGERLSDFEVLTILQEWNNRSIAPLDEAELTQAVVNGRSKGSPPADKPPEIRLDVPINVDFDALCKVPTEEQSEEISKEEFCLSMVPTSGLLRMVYDYYSDNAIKHSPVFGLAGAVSFVEALTGRRIESETGLRTNDYNLILAPTGSGKEAFQSAIGRLLMLAEESLGKSILVPEAVQSGNGLIGWMANQPLAYWVSDEFGKYLQAVLDKRGNKHLKDVGTLLLSLYGKSDGYYSGAAHSAGAKNRIEQPHLTILASSTATTIFDAVDESSVHDGLLARVAFWVVEDRPRRRKMRKVEPSGELVELVHQWLAWSPGVGNAPDCPPVAEILLMSDDAAKRWQHHAEEIDEKHDHESEAKAAIWARAAARSMKLAMVSVASRIQGDPGAVWWPSQRLEIGDIEWGIRLSNWLARSACQAIGARVVDKQQNRAKALLMTIPAGGSLAAQPLQRNHGVSKGDLEQAAKELGLERRIEKNSSGRPSVVYYRN